MYVIEVDTVDGLAYVHCHYPADATLAHYTNASLYTSPEQATRVARDVLNRANLRNRVYAYVIVKVRD